MLVDRVLVDEALMIEMWVFEMIQLLIRYGLENAHSYSPTIWSMLPVESMNMRFSSQPLDAFLTFTYTLIFLGLLCLSLSFLLNYIVTWILYQIGHRRAHAVKVPPTVPHLIPFLGNALDFGFDALNFIAIST